MNFILYNIYVRSKEEDFLIEKVRLKIMNKNLLKTSIELIDKIEKENDEYYSRQMASYSKVFNELEDLKELIQKAGELPEEERQRIFAIVNSVILNGKRDCRGEDLVTDVGYAIIEALENDEQAKLYEVILDTLVERDYVYGFINNHPEQCIIAHVITDRIMKANGNDR